MKTKSLTPTASCRVLGTKSPISAAATAACKFFNSKAIGGTLLALALAALFVNAATGRYTAVMAATVTAWAIHMAVGAAINIYKEGGQK